MLNGFNPFGINNFFYFEINKLTFLQFFLQLVKHQYQKNMFAFRKTVTDLLGSTTYEFPFFEKDHGFAQLLEDRIDPYETVSITIGNVTKNIPLRKAHIARVIDLFDQILKQVGTVNVHRNTLISVNVYKSGTMHELSLLKKPRTFEFPLSQGPVELSKILLSHDPSLLIGYCNIQSNSTAKRSLPLENNVGPVSLPDLRKLYQYVAATFSAQQTVSSLSTAMVTVTLMDKNNLLPKQPSSFQQESIMNCDGYLPEPTFMTSTNPNPNTSYKFSASVSSSISEVEQRQKKQPPPHFLPAGFGPNSRYNMAQHQQPFAEPVVTKSPFSNNGGNQLPPTLSDLFE
jgi:hypothetical protein